MQKRWKEMKRRGQIGGRVGGSGTAPSRKMLFRLEWEVPLKRFQIEHRRYIRKPTFLSRIQTTPVGALSLHWQLSLSQEEFAKRLDVLHRTRGPISTDGITYKAFLQHRAGSGRSQLKPALMTAISAAAASSCPPILSGEPWPSLAERHILPDHRVRVLVRLRIPPAPFQPLAIMQRLIAAELSGHGSAPAAEYADGAVGRALFAQLQQRLAEEHQDFTLTQQDFTFTANNAVPFILHGDILKGPKEADTAILCSRGTRPPYQYFKPEQCTYAHSAVLRLGGRFRAHAVVESPFSTSLRMVLFSHISTAAVEEWLHFVYLRRPSGRLHRAPLDEVLWLASSCPGQLLRLHVERLLLALVPAASASELDALWLQALRHGLPVLLNAVLSAAGPDAARLRHLRLRLDQGSLPDNLTRIPLHQHHLQRSNTPLL